MNIYTKEFCPNCEDLKEILTKKNIVYIEKDINNFKNKAKLVVRGFKDLPVIEINDKWFEFSELQHALEEIGATNDS